MLIVNNWWETKRKETKKTVGGKFHHTSPMQTTDIEKIILNSGVSQALNNQQYLESTEKLIQQIGQGQKPTRTKAKKSIVSFKLREGMEIGCKLTLRKKKAWQFLFNLINLSLPQIKNFRGLPNKSFDHQGNYNLGINDLNIFPETNYDLTFKNQGCQITIVFTSKNTEENKYFLELLNFPFQKSKIVAKETNKEKKNENHTQSQ
ncbi:50S ribosomal protein L5 [endosymbiont GvMRE of Glomus versiforme]|uniref:50S ribosomal protein L5 n=1 Tax=endosymbiont GvMRE of Glomus versiforme TaxID=2039283 RepID=UPI000EDF834F|nr:50S ribosomal protein L5 [endosymbiont GvMRE of Glomus versiforme]RHZ36888.1 50S ribosomal protein L5 [endosymbiont GvMRE of Glomus versiforme]